MEVLRVSTVLKRLRACHKSFNENSAARILRSRDWQLFDIPKDITIFEFQLHVVVYVESANTDFPRVMALTHISF